MSNKEQSETNSSKEKNNKSEEGQVALVEYQKIRDEVFIHINNANQGIVLLLGSASVVLPLLISQTANLQLDLMIIVLDILCILYSAISMHITTSQYYINSESNYIYQNLAPRVNSLLNLKTPNEILQGEHFNRQNRKNILAFLASTIGPAAVSIITIMPALISLLAIQYINTLQKTIIPTYGFLSNATLPLNIVAWVFFATSIFSLIAQILYTTVTGFIAKK